jgi:hypothetical protein
MIQLFPSRTSSIAEQHSIPAIESNFIQTLFRKNEWLKV